mgnify:CR=1 FL=1
MKKIILATVCIVVVSMIAISAFAAEYDLVINSGRDTGRRPGFDIPQAKMFEDLFHDLLVLDHADDLHRSRALRTD